MQKEWYILIEGQKEGPFSLPELKQDPRLTPDTLVWRKGFKDWVAIRFVPELKAVFEDEPESKPLHEEAEPPTPTNLPTEETLAIRQDPPQLFLWIIVLILLILYLFYLVNH